MKNNIELRHAIEMKEGVDANVKRLMPVPDFRNFDPFVLWDHFNVSPGTGFPDHPHRGFEAITYIFEGTMNHKDNLGNESTVTSGGAQRFTAGSGIVHSEMPSPEGNTRGIQLWINLPKRLKAIEPDYQQVNAINIPEQVIEKGKVRIIVGKDSPLELHTPARYLDVSLEPGGRFQETVPEGFQGFIYMVVGKATINGREVESGDAFFMDGIDKIHILANEGCRAMVCFGKPHDEPIRQYGSYVD